jgi:hypothetical protein
MQNNSNLNAFGFTSEIPQFKRNFSDIKSKVLQGQSVTTRYFSRIRSILFNAIGKIGKNTYYLTTGWSSDSGS